MSFFNYLFEGSHIGSENSLGSRGTYGHLAGAKLEVKRITTITAAVELGAVSQETCARVMPPMGDASHSLCSVTASYAKAK